VADHEDEKAGWQEENFFRQSAFSRRNDPARDPPHCPRDGFAAPLAGRWLFATRGKPLGEPTA